MGKWPTYADIARGPIGLREIASAFQGSLVERLLGAVWETYDVLLASNYRLVADWTQDLRDLERSLSQDFSLELAERVRRLDGGALPVSVQHGRFEHETQRTNVGQPPAYDIAFVWLAAPRIIWPLEAKALRDDRDTEAGPGEYVANGVRRYLDRTYAPFVVSGGMLAYLRSGIPQDVAEHIGRRLDVPLSPFTAFPDRDHWTTDHVRAGTSGAGTEAFVCHHLVVKLDA